MADYVTRDEFNELEARVTVLEGGTAASSTT